MVTHCQTQRHRVVVTHCQPTRRVLDVDSCLRRCDVKKTLSAASVSGKVKVTWSVNQCLASLCF